MVCRTANRLQQGVGARAVGARTGPKGLIGVGGKGSRKGDQERQQRGDKAEANHAACIAVNVRFVHAEAKPWACKKASKSAVARCFSSAVPPPARAPLVTQCW